MQRPDIESRLQRDISAAFVHDLIHDVTHFGLLEILFD